MRLNKTAVQLNGVFGDNRDGVRAKYDISAASLIVDKSTSVYILCGGEMDRIESGPLNKAFAVPDYDAFNARYNDLRGLNYA